MSCVLNRRWGMASGVVLGLATVAAMTVLGLGGCTVTGSTAPVDWPLHGLTTDEQRFSPLDQIDQSSVGKLRLAWWAEVDNDRGQEATPIEVGGVLYVSSGKDPSHFP